MTKRVSITLNDAQEAILRRRADAMGMTRSYIAKMALLRDLESWQAMSVRDEPLSLVDEERAKLDKEFA